MGKVITSVQNRKRNPRLKSLFSNGLHQYGTLEPPRPALMADYSAHDESVANRGQMSIMSPGG